MADNSSPLFKVYAVHLAWIFLHFFVKSFYVSNHRQTFLSLYSLPHLGSLKHALLVAFIHGELHSLHLFPTMHKNQNKRLIL